MLYQHILLGYGGFHHIADGYELPKNQACILNQTKIDNIIEQLSRRENTRVCDFLRLFLFTLAHEQPKCKKKKSQK
jgi:hypothetical protein